MTKESNKKKKITPLMRQYLDMKAKYPDAILLYRVGDFYETFGEDAIQVSHILGIVLTNRNNGGSKIELAGFPYHSLDLYLPKLIRAGLRIAVCEQLEKPSKEKKIVKRGVTEMITPGLNSYEHVLDQKTNNYLMCVHSDGESAGLVFLDFSTGELSCFEGIRSEINQLIHKYRPAEIIYSKEENIDWIDLAMNPYLHPIDNWHFDQEYATDNIKRQFQVKGLKGFGIDNWPNAVSAIGGVLHYLDSTENNSIAHINQISKINTGDYLSIDHFTARNLELIESQHSKGISLFQILDQCKSPMGARLLKKWILFPLVNLDRIESRQEAIIFLMENLQRFEQLFEELNKIGDAERLIGRLAAKKINPRQINAIRSFLKLSQKFKLAFGSVDQNLLLNQASNITALLEYAAHIDRLFLDDLPAVLGKAPILKTGANEELDQLYDLLNDSKKYLLQLQQKEIEKTGIDKLKIGFNNVFGYYLEVTNKYKDKFNIPDNWIRKQTLTNSERYITPELKELEEEIKNAEGRILLIEQEEYEKFLNHSKDQIKTLQGNIKAIAHFDVLHSLAIVAQKNDYYRPSFSSEGLIKIKEGRHPMIEHQLSVGESYIANDVLLDQEAQQILLITGPNMSGKSAVLRQTAIICILSQMGSMVPAQTCIMCPLDAIFTRVGANDNITSGESTFMVEMNETANILNNLNHRSLLLMDEIGRGTSTFDGISIAWSIVEYLHQLEKKRPFTLFATHYHELSELANTFPRIKNYHVSTKKIGNNVVFLRKLQPGSIEHSFGIYVAQLAGMPKPILNRAEEILSTLESQQVDPNNQNDVSQKVVNKSQQIKEQTLKQEAYQMSFFQLQDQELVKLREELEGLNLDHLSPYECYLMLKKWKKDLSN